ncbi:MAG: YbjN domain-containing protein [Spirochaetales bacterium]|nr:YbjN domain-containing protein [Spirochaetales bacterium]
MPEEFKRTEAAPLDETIQMIEKMLKEWNIPPESVKDKQKNMWYLVQGSASFHLELFKFNKGPELGEVNCVEVGGVIMKLPQENLLPLYRRLLELNSSAVGLYFAIRRDLVMLIATREIAGMDFGELKTMVDEVRYFADYWDEILMKEFGGTK